MDDDEDEYVQLNMEHPLNRAIVEASRTMTPRQYRRWWERNLRRWVFDSIVEVLEHPDNHPRTHKLRAFLLAFRGGFRAGHGRGFRVGRSYQRKLSRRRDKHGG